MVVYVHIMYTTSLKSHIHNLETKSWATKFIHTTFILYDAANLMSSAHPGQWNFEIDLKKTHPYISVSYIRYYNTLIRYLIIRSKPEV